MVAFLSKLNRRTSYLLLLQHLNLKYRKSIWVIQLFKERETKGAFNLLVKDMALYDQEYFFKFFRMTPTKYEQLLQLVASAITKCSIRREAIGPSERLTVSPLSDQPPNFQRGGGIGEMLLLSRCYFSFLVLFLLYSPTITN